MPRSAQQCRRGMRLREAPKNSRLVQHAAAVRVLPMVLQELLAYPAPQTLQLSPKQSLITALPLVPAWLAGQSWPGPSSRKQCSQSSAPGRCRCLHSGPNHTNVNPGA